MDSPVYSKGYQTFLMYLLFKPVTNEKKMTWITKRVNAVFDPGCEETKEHDSCVAQSSMYHNNQVFACHKLSVV